jgi:hypothetical protein
VNSWHKKVLVSATNTFYNQKTQNIWIKKNNTILKIPKNGGNGCTKTTPLQRAFA